MARLEHVFQNLEPTKSMVEILNSLQFEYSDYRFMQVGQFKNRNELTTSILLLPVLLTLSIAVVQR